MNKVFADTYWCMIGRWSGEKPKLVAPAWMTSTLPPFYRGAGLAIRTGPWSIRFGVCYPRMPVTVDPYTYVDDTEANIEALAGYVLETKEIRKWGSSTDSSQKQDTERSSDASSPG